MTDRPGITFSIYTSQEIHRDLEAIARQEHRSVSSMASIFLEHAIDDWRKRHAADSEALPCSSTS
jgi:predicted transcriptional regulator